MVLGSRKPWATAGSMPGDCLLFWLIHSLFLLDLLMVEGVKVLILFMKAPTCEHHLKGEDLNKRLEVGIDIHTIAAPLFPTCPVLSALKLHTFGTHIYLDLAISLPAQSNHFPCYIFLKWRKKILYTSQLFYNCKKKLYCSFFFKSQNFRPGYKSIKISVYI